MMSTNAESSISLFNVQANRRVFKELTTQHERDRHYIEELQKLLKNNNISIPAEVEEIITIKPVELKREVSDPASLLMKDGSLATLEKTVDRAKQHQHLYDINVQYKNLTFWNNVPNKTIPTVGSTLKSMVCGNGPTHRVDIVKNLTGRIMPKTMTLLMGPPGCGKCRNIACNLETLHDHFCTLLY